MISFVWSDKLPLYSGRGGTESYTIGHVRELKQRGIAARIITLGLGVHDGREYYDDIEFVNFDDPAQLSEIDDTIVYVNFPFTVPTKRKNYVIFHYPPLDSRTGNKIDYLSRLHKDTRIMTNSRFMRGVWADHLNINPNKIHIVYPFADPVYATVKRVKHPSKKIRVLFAGRLIPDKGIYLLLEALHHKIIRKKFDFTVTNAGNQTESGVIIERLLRHHPWVRVIQARRSPADMARLYARYDIVVVPSNHTYWHEAFGMVSVEAQHAGCKVIATFADGLPETNCGELILFKPGDSYDLALKICKAAKTGPILPEQRAQTIQHFTRSSSVDALLRTLESS
jgi:D-inositol-3-phosphate glycosyltransferase